MSYTSKATSRPSKMIHELAFDKLVECSDKIDRCDRLARELAEFSLDSGGRTAAIWRGKLQQMARQLLKLYEEVAP